MRSLGTRRVSQAAGAATVALIALAGCSSGQVAETALLKAPVSGLSTQSADGGLLIRNLQVVYNNPTGYAAGASAPLEVSLFNQTRQPMTVTITSRPRQEASAGIVSAQQVSLTGGAAAASPSANPEPSGSRPPANSGLPSDQVPQSGPASEPGSAPTVADAPAQPTSGAGAGQPARITLPPLSSATYLPGDSAGLQANGLSGKLAPGYSLSLTIAIEGSGAPLDVLAPFAIPTSPASRAPGLEAENHGE
jgi:hypothetical protein